MSPRQPEKLVDFISNARDNFAMFREPQKYLKATERAFGIAFWVDQDINAGRRWRAERDGGDDRPEAGAIPRRRFRHGKSPADTYLRASPSYSPHGRDSLTGMVQTSGIA